MRRKTVRIPVFDLVEKAVTAGTAVQNAKVRELINAGWEVSKINNFGDPLVVVLRRSMTLKNQAGVGVVMPDASFRRPTKTEKSVTYKISDVEHLYNLNK
jgi:hypothetical protein